MIAADDRSRCLFKRLHLANAPRVWRDLVERARARGAGPTATSSPCSSPRRSPTASRRGSRGSRAAPRFPFLKTIDDFDFTYQSTVRLPLLGSALSPGLRHRGPLPDPLRQSRAAAKRTSRSPSPTARSRTASTRSSPPPPSSSTISRPRSATGRLAEALATLHAPGRARRRRGRLSHVRHRCRQHALPRRQRSPPAPARDDLHHQQVRSRVGRRAPRRRPRRRPSSTASSSAAASSRSTAHRCAPNISALTTRRQPTASTLDVARISGITRPEFPEPTLRTVDELDSDPLLVEVEVSRRRRILGDRATSYHHAEIRGLSLDALNQLLHDFGADRRLGPKVLHLNGNKQAKRSGNHKTRKDIRALVLRSRHNSRLVRAEAEQN